MHTSSSMILGAFPRMLERMDLHFTVEGERIYGSEITDVSGVLPVFMSSALLIEQVLGTSFLKDVRFVQDGQALLGWSLNMDDPVNPVILGLFLMQGAHQMAEIPHAVRQDGEIRMVDLRPVVETLHMEEVIAWQGDRRHASSVLMNLYPQG